MVLNGLRLWPAVQMVNLRFVPLQVQWRGLAVIEMSKNEMGACIEMSNLSNPPSVRPSLQLRSLFLECISFFWGIYVSTMVSSSQVVCVWAKFGSFASVVFACLSIGLSVCLSVFFLSVCLSVLLVCLSACLPAHLFVRLCVWILPSLALG